MEKVAELTQRLVIYVPEPHRAVVKLGTDAPFFIDASLLSLGALLRSDRAWWLRQPLN